MGLTIIMIFGLGLPWLRHSSFSWWPWAVGGTLVVWAFVAPSRLEPLFVGWMKVGSVLGRINAVILLTIVFGLIFVPIGVVRRLLRKHVASREPDSYRVNSSSRSAKHMERPF
jgi:hypothetical protein